MNDLLISFEMMMHVLHPPKPKPAPTIWDDLIPFKELLDEFRNYEPPPYRGPGADWDAVCEYERKQIHARIDLIFHPRQHKISDFMRRKGMEIRFEPKYIIGIDPYL
jgi:hypothetical protein